MIQAVAPSFNFPRATIADGTDHIRPATLRGLSPDQTLCSINGKRRHTSALVNLNGFVGRGAQAVDLNAIPASMIDHIEILRDGAAAQYGSDAIAGVINIVLKSDAPGTYTFETGENVDHVQSRRELRRSRFPDRWIDAPCTTATSFTTSLNYGWTFGSKRLLPVRRRGARSRRNEPLAPRSRARNTSPAIRATRTAPAMHFWQGDSYNHDDAALLQRRADVRERHRSCMRSADTAAGAAPPPGSGAARTTIARCASIYPDGFLPFIKSDIDDGSLGRWPQGRRRRAGSGTSAPSYGRNAFRLLDRQQRERFARQRVARRRSTPASSPLDQSTTTLDLIARSTHAMARATAHRVRRRVSRRSLRHHAPATPTRIATAA